MPPFAFRCDVRLQIEICLHRGQIMHLSLIHQNLNIFHHFGDSAQNENNTTRAFLIAATRSPWSPMLLRGFFDLVAARIRERLPDQAAVLGCFSQSWPDQVEISMERDIKAESFPGVGVERAIIVELTPLAAALDLPQQTTEVGDSGRVDATIVIRQSESDGLALIIESKLHGRAGHEQLLRYRQALENRQIKTVLVDVAWEEVYALADDLPEAAEHDPIIGDFKSFLARDPRLAGFTGFQKGDFTGPAYVLDGRLQKLSESLAGQSLDPVLRSAQVERKRGGLDYDMLLSEQSRLVGNIGLACWEQKGLYAKLVIGWRSRWETDRVIKFGAASELVNGLIRRLVGHANLTINASVRPFFNKFQYPEAAQWSKVIKRNDDPLDAWATAIEFARSYHAKSLDPESLGRLQRIPVTVLDQESLNKALEKQVNCFVPLVFAMAWEPEYITRMKSEELMKTVRAALVDLAQLLLILSGVSVPSGS